MKRFAQLMLIFFLTLVLYQNGCHYNNPSIKNVILFIGDGMGISQVTSVRIYLLGANDRFHMETLPITGLVTVHSLDRLITDSAAGATAMATGFKTRNGMVAMLPDSTRLYTILQAARDEGKSSGLIATSSITHATPACFAGHVMTRQDHPTIARHLLESRVNVLLGGGRGYFVPAGQAGSLRNDDTDLLKQAKTLGYAVIDHRDSLDHIRGDKLLGLFSSEYLEGNPTEPTLAEMTGKALEILTKNRKGFFLMVEGSQIDWAGHSNDFEYLVREMEAFDEAVGVGLDFARKNGETLLIVTADHETGGLNITGGGVGGKDIEISWQGDGHTGQMVPVLAFGPGADGFTGVMDNTDIALKMARALQIDKFPRRLDSREIAE